ncbi:hypothetical protein K2173_021708 [Erythroxylum novogranatense]|uniref:glyoxylate reductase (NADP(+)) n=1 Tax=Erythroxylum novogranatense TaxID=1862640 RepID=A0AAV8TH92_9ROSI|nr:hypothetical protein K2173_021708 [Erythroxylum novogranatense]
MAANKNPRSQEPNDDLPLVYVHRQTSFGLPLKDRLVNHFRLVDPCDCDSTHKPIDTSLSNSVRALVVIGYTPLTSETLSFLPSLELVVGSSAGLDKVDLQECHRRGIVVTNASLAFSEDAADYAMALLLDVLRRISAAERYIRGRMWPVKGDYRLGSKLRGKRAGIVGLGAIGSEVAKRLMAFGCTIAYNSRKKKPSVLFPFYSTVCDLAANSDILIITCSLTPKTRHIVNKDVMTALGSEGLIINVGRGALIDQEELVQFLMRGNIYGAGLDVFENEPHVPEELFALENVVLSPHRAVLTPESLEAVQELIFTNLKAFFSNEPLRSVVHIE